jgi:hypothetical protein
MPREQPNFWNYKVLKGMWGLNRKVFRVHIHFKLKIYLIFDTWLGYSYKLGNFKNDVIHFET